MRAEVVIMRSMGGAYGEVRGATKIETYLRYLKEATDREGSWYTDPAHKKDCKEEMERDPNTGEWVLRYHWHT